MTDEQEKTIKDTPLKELAEWGLRAAQRDEHRQTCSACGVRFDWDSEVGPAHTDDYHRFTQLCGDCYYDDAANYATAWKIKGWGLRNSPETPGLDDSGRPIRQ
jgi:hypothetical protein